MPGYNNFYVEASLEEIQRFTALSTLERSEFNYSIDPNLLMEMIINDVMLKSRKYENNKKREERDFETEFEIRIKFIEKQIEINGDNI